MSQTTWNIRVSGYGTFQMTGTEAEAEDMLRHKARWERGSAMKWRADLAREEDRIRQEMAGLWDAHQGVPRRLLNRLRRAMLAAAPEDARDGR